MEKVDDKNYLFQFLKYIKDVKLAYIIGFTILILEILLNTFSTKILSGIFDENTLIMTKDLLRYALKISLLYLFLKILHSISLILRKIILQRAGNNIFINIQKEVYTHIQNLPIKYFDEIPAGSVLSRIVSDCRAIRAFFVDTLITTLLVIFQIIIIYSIMLYIDFKLSLIILFFIPIVIILQKINQKSIYNYSKDYRSKNSLANGFANEMCQNLEVVVAFNNQEAILNKWKKIVEDRKFNWDKMILIESFILHNAFELLLTLIKLTIIIYYIISSYYNLNLINAANTIVFIFYSRSIMHSITDLTANLSNYSRAKAASKNLSEVLKLKIEEDLAIVKNMDFNGNIEFKNVYFAYKDEEYVLKDINLEIKENQTVAFIGHTGSGKSTIMNLLVKFYSNQKGQILIDKKDIKEINSEFLRDNTAIVLQDSFLFKDSIKENISTDENKAIEALKMLGAYHIVEERGINGEVFTDGSNFSTGEKQLISFARALVKNPKILILDEATANIDSKTEQLIQNGINILKKNRTTLIIAHRLSTIRHVDKIFVLDKGQIVESGNHDELVEKNGIYAKMLKMNNSKILN